MFTAGDLTGAESTSNGPPPVYTHRTHPGGSSETYTDVEWHLVQYWEQSGRDSDVEIYRANHHDSQYSSLPALVNRLDPEFVIYSCGGSYRHPNVAVVKRIAKTAWQYVTHALDWSDPAAFNRYGEVVGEIQIHVTADGNWYRINHEWHKAYSDEEEDGLTISANGSGSDVGEERIEWVDE